MTAAFTFRVPGGPTGKGRPRFTAVNGRPRVRTPQATVRAEERVQAAWRLAGARDLGTAPIAVGLVVVHARPGSHFRVDGSLGAAARRSPRPLKTPDLDNVLKLVCDALNGHAYTDDKQVVDVTLARRWADPGEREHMTVTLRALPATLPAPDEAAA